MPKWFKIRKFRIHIETLKKPTLNLERILQNYTINDKTITTTIQIYDYNLQKLKTYTFKGTLRKDNTVVFSRIKPQITTETLEDIKKLFKMSNEKALIRLKSEKIEKLKELKKYGYNMEYDDNRKKWLAWRKQYLDNGYGFYFTADIDLEINQNGEITEIKVDGLTLSEIEKEIEKTISECPIMQKYGACAEQFDLITREKIENEIDIDLCQTCTYYSMIQSLAESLECGNW